MSRAIAFLAGLGVGNLDEKRRLEREEKDNKREARQIAREDKADSRAEEIYSFQKSERDLAVNDRTALRAASTPVPVVPDAVMPETMDARDVGQPGEAPLPVTGYKVGAARFASQGLADAEAGRQTQQRTMQTLRSQGKHGEAAQMQTAERQDKLAQVQLSAAEAQMKEAARKAMNEGVLEALQAASGGASPEQVAAIYNRNGEKRVTNLKVEPFEFDHPTLGKQRSARLVGTFEDGTPLQVKDAFSSSLDLFGAAQKYKLLGDWAKDKADRDDKAADNARQDKRDAATERYQSGMLRNASEANAARLEIAALRAAATAARQGDGKAPIWNEKADEFLLKHYGTKDDQTGASSLDGNGANFAKIIALAASQKFGGDTMRAIAYAIDQDDLLKQAAARGAAESGGKINPQEALRSLRAQTMQRLFNPGQEQPKPTAPPPAQEKTGGFAELAARGIGAGKQLLQGTQAEGAAYTAIQARARQAGSGGPPLTPAEKAEAKRFGIGLAN